MVFLWLFMVIRLCTMTPLDGWKVPGVLTLVSAPADTRSGVVGPWRSLGPVRGKVAETFKGVRDALQQAYGEPKVAEFTFPFDRSILYRNRRSRGYMYS